MVLSGDRRNEALVPSWKKRAGEALRIDIGLR